MHREIRKVVWRGTKILNQENVTPEVCPCDTPKILNQGIRRSPEVYPCDTPKILNQENWSTPRFILQVPENPESGKTGRGPEDDREMSQRHLAVPEDDLKPYCKNALGAKLQYPERQARGRPEDTLVENPESGKSTTPEVSPSVVPRMTLHLPERKSGFRKTAHHCVHLPKMRNP